ncbi:MAG: hypothetical protein QF449_09885 [Alphaproteobacteria bacterium]|jgi:hypothetical protein|nr:hypothetical protein [Alphaproteobacteria bacterium]|tara:strand:- start:49 stop:684 length:636 start_codon:yes stop_codon:yes gene_type:complete
MTKAISFCLGRGLFVALAMALLPSGFAAAHHVLGRPAYSLNEDSNTPPGTQIEAQIGDYVVTYMAYPAFPRPDSPGRINLYASRIDDGTPFAGEVTFKVRDDSWLSGIFGGDEQETLGTQNPDGNVFRQGFLFEEEGDYMISAEFESGGEPYIVDFQLRIGEPTPYGILGVAVALVLAALIGVSLIQRRRAMAGKIRDAHQARGKSPHGSP